MQHELPAPLQLERTDTDFLAEIAQRVLGNSAVAATTATRLSTYGFDSARVDELIPLTSKAVEAAGFVFKKIEADKESPGNFGLFVRRRGESANPFGVAPASRAERGRRADLSRV